MTSYELTPFRIGHGYDVHRLVPERRLVLGGIEIPYKLGLLGHSDADCLLHAIMDAVLGALGEGDIGKHFPDHDAAYSGIDSKELVLRVATLMHERGYTIGNIDATVVAQKPKLAPYIEQMRRTVASLFSCSLEGVNIKATTEEGLGFTGRGEAISAHAVCLLFHR